MSKYIPAEKLIAEIERLKEKFSEDFIFSRDEEGAKRERLIESEIHARIKCVLCDTFIELVTTLQQEQPEVELEKFTEKIKTFQTRYKYPEIVSIKGAMAFMARMFYQYPNVARQWYEQLPKATID